MATIVASTTGRMSDRKYSALVVDHRSIIPVSWDFVLKRWARSVSSINNAGPTLADLSLPVSSP